MRSYPNIEKSAFRRATYIGYAASDGALFYITKDAAGWQAVRRHCPAETGVNIGREERRTVFYAANMTDISDMLTRL